MSTTPFKTFICVSATWFGCGRAPRAPGTFGTLGAIPLAFALSKFFSDIGYMAITLLLVVFSIFVATAYEEMTGRHDSPEFVLDEVVGFLVTMAMVPMHPAAILVGFSLFRLFDILKPFPISYIDRKMPGGVGAVADDLLAGIFSNIVLQVLLSYGWLGR